MRATTRFTAVLLAFAIFACPIYADGIPTNLPDAEKESAQAKVTARLTQLGYAPEQAKSSAATLSKEVLVRYAHAPNALQLVGQAGPSQGQGFFAGDSTNMFWETIGGIFAIGVVAGVLVIAATNHE